MLTIKHLIIFKEVARTKSMSKAAENLYISQPTVSQKIQEIENYYHIKLFQRYAKHLGISEEGQMFLEHANKVLAEMEAIDDTFFHNREDITLRVGSTLTVASTIAPKLFKEIQTRYPHLKFQVYVDNTQSIENMILENQLDIAIVEGDIHNDQIVHEGIIPDRLVLVCAKDHPFFHKETITIEELHHQTFILREKGSGTRSMLEQFINLYKIPYNISWQCHSWESIKQAAIQNQGLTLISIRLVEKEIADGDLHILNIQNWNWNRMFSLCYHKNKAWNQNLDIFRQSSIRYIYCPLLEIRQNKTTPH